MKKVVFIIPGYQHLTAQLEYQQIGAFFEKQEITPVFIDIPWKRTVITENLKFFLDKFNETKADKKYILGFSFGAVISFLASTRVKVDGQILCSLSPYFKEDLPRIKKWWALFIGKRRYADFFKLEAELLAKDVHANTTLVYGSLETPLIAQRALEVYEWLQVKKTLAIVDGAKHDLADPNYLKTLKSIIQKI